MPWKINSWWTSGEYKGRHRERLTSYTMGYMHQFYGVPLKRQPTYKLSERQEQPATP